LEDYSSATECANRHLDGFTSSLRLATNISNAGGKAAAEFAINRHIGIIQPLSIPCIAKNQAKTATQKGAITVKSFVSEFDTATQRKEADSADDAMLVAVARSGDSSAFVELSQRHSRRVLHKIFRITNNWQDAEDVLQESLMRAFLHLHTFECRASFSTWLTRIAINTALMLLRKRKGTRRSAIDSSLDDIGQSEKWELRDHRDNPEQHYARQQRASMLSGAMLQLRPGSRRVLELQHAGELSTKEIARSLGISEPAVKSRLLRARIELKEFVQNKTSCYHSFSGSHSAPRCK
jgi:RNA polymerase sigma-70 factor (ECF subfamily)